ncbi:MAG: RNA polymerase sigma factor [Gammaproteobacteria bacterium]|nr:RNA polymerase sigma factor [Gammaproteobacteria bacterium]
MVSSQSIEQFLAGIERRALRMAQFATGNSDEALDLVQEAMIGLVRGYRGRPPDEWAPLFHRILQSRIRDWQRRSRVRNRWRAWLHSSDPDDDSRDPWQDIADPGAKTPGEQLALTDGARALETALRALPARQREAFLLRVWEGLDVAQTAYAMGCSEGSVKTHYSRAVHSLRDSLEDHWE